MGAFFLECKQVGAEPDPWQQIRHESLANQRAVPQQSVSDSRSLVLFLLLTTPTFLFDSTPCAHDFFFLFSDQRVCLFTFCLYAELLTLLNQWTNKILHE